MNTHQHTRAANYNTWRTHYHLPNNKQTWSDYLRYLEELQIFASLIGEKR